MNSSPPNITDSVPPLARETAGPPALKLTRVVLVVVLLVLLAAASGILPRWRERAALRTQTAQLAVPSVIVT